MVSGDGYFGMFVVRCKGPEFGGMSAPEGRLTIARHFNAGSSEGTEQVPAGRLKA